MNIADSDKFSIAKESLDKSLSLSLPVLIKCASILAAEHSIFCDICWADISIEKNNIGFFRFVPTCSAIFNTKLVLPIPGHAAIIINSPFCNPHVISSRSIKPVGIPANLLSPSCKCTI